MNRMNRMNGFAMIVAVFVVLVSTFAMPAGAGAPDAVAAVKTKGYSPDIVDYGPRSRCRDRAKAQWKACRMRDRRRNDSCDRQLERSAGPVPPLGFTHPQTTGPARCAYMPGLAVSRTSPSA